MSAVAEVATEVVETVAGAAEETIEALDHINNLNGTTLLQQRLILGGVVLVAGGLGIALGWHLANKKLAMKYELIVEEELEKSRKFLHEKAMKVEKEGAFEDPVEMLRKMVEGGYVPNSEEEALLTDMPAEVNVFVTGDDERKAGVVDYSAMYTATDETIEDLKAGEKSVEIQEEVRVVTKKVFETPVERTEQDEWALLNEGFFADGRPHVVSVDDYMENEDEWETTTLTYFAADDVLIDDTEIIVENVDGVVGELNLKRFGWLSNDSRMVYIKQPEYKNLFEVVLSDGSYSEQVLGLQHSDETFEPRRRPRRRGDDE